MTTTTDKTKTKRLPKSKRKYIRQIKQDGRKEGLDREPVLFFRVADDECVEVDPRRLVYPRNEGVGQAAR